MHEPTDSTRTNCEACSPRAFTASLARVLAIEMRVAIWLAVLGPIGTARADDLTVVPCRPAISCTADLAAPGTLEIELGYQARGFRGFQHTTPFLIKLPATSWIEAQVGGNGFTYLDPDHRYFDNVTLGAKLHFVDQTARRPSLAVSFAAGVPVAAQRGFIEAYDLFATAYASKDIGGFHIDANIGLDVWQLHVSTRYQPWIAVAADHAVTSMFSITLEPHYFGNATPVEPRDAGVIAAITFTPRPWIVIDAGIDAVGWDQRSLSALAGVSFAPVRLWMP